LIELDKFVNFFEADPHYFERSWLLIPDNSDKPYALLRKLLEKTGMAAIGKVTMSTRERVVLIHYYQNAVVATTLRYPDEVREPSHFAELKDLPEAGEAELSMMTEIVDKMTIDLDLRLYHDGYKGRIEA
jgi:DNA end-binding protein Ku